ncbi:factor of DNA methylation 1-like [Chenopodium quinoa]|uniref:factor of DNA methylation 1-like n=1 Tax=Chenopodium quinoa TaxID=63459 RepID=UPI000B77DCD7|nr:factor of DNA methylation 1-like [Chenopodium quinoa]
MEESSAEKMSSETTIISPDHQTNPLSSTVVSETIVTSTCLSIESQDTTCSLDKLIASLCKEVEDKDARIMEVEQKYNQTCESLSKFITSLVKEIEDQVKRMKELKVENEKKDAACKSISRALVSFMNEVDRKNQQITDLKHTCSEMYSDIRTLVEERALLHRLNIRAENELQSISRRNKRLKSELITVKKELTRQLVQSVGGPQSNEGQSRSMQGTGCSNIDINALKKELEDKTDEVLYLQNLNQILILKERESNNELLEAQQELLSGLHSILSNRTMLGIKRMGELDTKPFLEACADKFPKEEQGIKCAEVCSIWEDHLKDSKWHPFKHDIINGNLQAIIDESDEKLEELRKEWGEKAYKTVATALMELNEYNPSGRYPVPKIWNIREEREVSLKEVIGYIIQQLKTHKRKRR